MKHFYNLFQTKDDREEYYIGAVEKLVLEESLKWQAPGVTDYYPADELIRPVDLQHLRSKGNYDDQFTIFAVAAIRTIKDIETFWQKRDKLKEENRVLRQANENQASMITRYQHELKQLEVLTHDLNHMKAAYEREKEQKEAVDRCNMVLRASLNARENSNQSYHKRLEDLSEKYQKLLDEESEHKRRLNLYYNCFEAVKHISKLDL